MNNVNEDLKKYIEDNIFKLYEKNESGHGIEHIKYVIDRSFKFSEKINNIDYNMVYVIASFHDLAHHIDKNNHEILSAKLFYEDETMKQFFNDDQRKIIKEAIEDHRASLEHKPRSIYGCIISTADRNVDIASSLKRTHSYTIKHYPTFDLDQMVKRAYNHLGEKFGNTGYAKIWLEDDEYNKFKKELQKLLADKKKFREKYIEVNDINK